MADAERSTYPMNLLALVFSRSVGFLFFFLLSAPPAQATPPKPADVPEVCIAFVGDLMHHCTQSTGARRIAGNDGYDFRKSFDETRSLLSAADYTVGNLETPIDGRLEGHCFPKFSAPIEYLDALADAGFDLLSLANNHALDRGSDGLTRTLERIAVKGMRAIGVTPGFEISRVDIGAMPATFFALTKFSNRSCKSSPCPVMLPSADDLGELVAEIRSEAEQGRAVVVLLHWMSEYQIRPRKGQRTIADALLDAGALIIIGGHSHVLGTAILRDHRFRSRPESKVDDAEIESHDRRVFIRYSLGNFVHAMKRFPAKLGGVDTVCIQHLDGMPTVSRIAFTPTYIRRSAGPDASRIFQPVPLLAALNQCEAGAGPFAGLSKRECREMKTAQKHLGDHPDLLPTPTSKD